VGLQHPEVSNEIETLELVLCVGTLTAATFVPTASTRRSNLIRAITLVELDSAIRGNRKPRIGMIDLVALLALRDWKTAARLVREDAQLIRHGGAATGALHLMAKRGDVEAAKWLLDHGADPNARWNHRDSAVTPLHLAILGGHADIVRMLLEAGADPTIHDTKHDSDAIGWAEFFRLPDIVQIFKANMHR
jgi:hypothetical protein